MTVTRCAQADIGTCYLGSKILTTAVLKNNRGYLHFFQVKISVNSRGRSTSGIYNFFNT